MELIDKYFPDLSDEQHEKLAQLKAVYEHWNNQINVISRKDMDDFYERHVLHSLAIAKVINFRPGTKILDIGTGGGFPGIPLAILFPECHFFLVDSIGKKIKVVKEVAAELELKNVRAAHERAENIKEKFDFVVSRAVTAMPRFLPWTNNKFLKEQNNSYPNGIFYLKGGDLTEELKGIRQDMEIVDLTKFFDEAFFETKKVVYVRMVR
ncbi:16S rRNA (guanine(527)-N(7))-methyltransferase RsmG [Wandonia haliotis]|uniref:Ribosomal RNA small subunit methyltransferase G n=1 Tax=Wandonia haliotis TaxID=574963 RepID=A0ABN1MQY7_9FLAO